MRLLLLLLGICFGCVAFGQQVRVVNQAGIDRGHYLRIQDAYNDAVNGDTLVLFPGNHQINTIEKDLTIIGSGFRLADNYSGQPELIGDAELKVGSIHNTVFVHIEGVKFEALGISPLNIYNVEEVIIESCYLPRGIEVYNCNVVHIRKNRFQSPWAREHWDNNRSCAIAAYGNSFVVVRNNIFDKQSNNSFSYSTIASPPPDGTGAYLPNQFEFYLYNTCVQKGPDLHNAVIYGNITSFYPCSLNDTRHNVGGPSCGDTTNITAHPNDIFLDYSAISAQSQNVPDSAYLLAPNSPAIGAGPNGTDCGAFGGDDPYVLSGTPRGPFIYYFDAPIQTAPGAGIDVTVKVKAID